MIIYILDECEVCRSIKAKATLTLVKDKIRRLEAERNVLAHIPTRSVREVN